MSTAMEQRIRDTFAQKRQNFETGVYYVGRFAHPVDASIWGKHGQTVTSNWPKGRRRQINDGLRYRMGLNAHFEYTHYVMASLAQVRALESLIAGLCRENGYLILAGRDYYAYDELVTLAEATCNLVELPLQQYQPTAE